MPCKDVLVEKVLTLKPDQKVEPALKALGKEGVTFAPVVEDSGEFVGVFSISRLLFDVLPVSVSVGEGGSFQNIRIPAAPGMAKRLQKDLAGLVSQLMERHVPVVSPETPLETAIRHIRQQGEPVVVIDEKSGIFRGLVTEQSLLTFLKKSGS